MKMIGMTPYKVLPRGLLLKIDTGEDIRSRGESVIEEWIGTVRTAVGGFGGHLDGRE